MRHVIRAAVAAAVAVAVAAVAAGAAAVTLISTAAEPGSICDSIGALRTSAISTTFPRQEGCRSRWSAVQARISTSPTSTGSTQRAARAYIRGTGVAKGLVDRASGSSRSSCRVGRCR